MAVGLARYRFPGKTLYRGISYLPLIIPDIAIAVATLVFLAAVAIPQFMDNSGSPCGLLPCLRRFVVSSRLANLDPT